MLRDKGAVDYFKEVKAAGTFSIGKETSETFKARYLSTQFSHGQLAAGANTLYNRVSTQMRNQMSPTERKIYDAKFSANIKSYTYELTIYRNFVK